MRNFNASRFFPETLIEPGVVMKNIHGNDVQAIKKKKRNVTVSRFFRETVIEPGSCQCREHEHLRIILEQPRRGFSHSMSIVHPVKT